VAGLGIEEAVLLPGTDEARAELARFRIAPRVTLHVRHLQEYVPVPESQAFVFTRAGQPTGVRAQGKAGGASRQASESTHGA
jgi:hypothetical protein